LRWVSFRLGTQCDPGYRVYGVSGDPGAAVGQGVPLILGYQKSGDTLSNCHANVVDGWAVFEYRKPLFPVEVIA
jgi:hypothetical protein